MKPMVSVVVIGRNEGDRLSKCLTSVREANWQAVEHELIYVDSGSKDDSCERARAGGAQVLTLDDPSPCAAKGRNLGWQQAQGEFVLFLDGDTLLHPDFVHRALEGLRDPAICAVWGHRRESAPEQSWLTRVLDLDWVYPVGRTLYFGGDVLVRRAALQGVGGFDPTLTAGEEPELCARLRAAGWQIEHIDAPMTLHDLAIRTWRAYARRAYRSGIAYAEVAQRMKGRGDPLWQREAARDFRHGLLFVSAPLWLALAAAASPALALALLGLGGLLLVRTARRSAWKAPGRPMLQLQYAVHVHLQKLPSFFGQLAWRRARRAHTALGLVDYKEPAAGARAMHDGSRPKALLTTLLQPVARIWRGWVLERWLRLWSAARLREAIGGALHPSNVVLGPVDVQGTARVRFGRGAMVYPGVVLETQGEGVIEIGDRVVLSRGVHIVAFERVQLDEGAMVGEYSSLRDANHRRSTASVRDSGHEHAPIQVGRNAWIGRGVTVLSGVTLGESCVVGANAVVTRSVLAQTVVAGTPARRIDTQRPDTPAAVPASPARA